MTKTKEKIYFEVANSDWEIYPGMARDKTYKAMQDYADQQTASLQSENESLRAALKELVALKDMKDKAMRFNDLIDYVVREPLAWEQARKLSNPE